MEKVIVIVLAALMVGCSTMPNTFEGIEEARRVAEQEQDAEMLDALAKREQELFKLSEKAILYYSTLEACEKHKDYMVYCQSEVGGLYRGPSDNIDQRLMNYRRDKFNCGCVDRDEATRMIRDSLR